MVMSEGLGKGISAIRILGTLFSPLALTSSTPGRRWRGPLRTSSLEAYLSRGQSSCGLARGVSSPSPTPDDQELHALKKNYTLKNFYYKASFKKCSAR